MAQYDTAKLLAFLNEKWKGATCPMCKVGNWTAQDTSFQISEFNIGGTVIGGPVIPIIPVTCRNCGFTVAVNAIIAGAHDGNSPPGDPTAKGDAS